MEYLILSLKWTRKADRYVTFWGPNNCGYRWALSEAGRYSEEQIRARSGYYDNGDSTLAVPVDVVMALASEGSEHVMDRRPDMRVVARTDDNMEKLRTAAAEASARRAGEADHG